MIHILAEPNPLGVPMMGIFFKLAFGYQESFLPGDIEDAFRRRGALIPKRLRNPGSVLRKKPFIQPREIGYVLVSLINFRRTQKE